MYLVDVRRPRLVVSIRGPGVCVDVVHVDVQARSRVPAHECETLGRETILLAVVAAVVPGDPLVLGPVVVREGVQTGSEWN
jgi:hypothetical protein